MNEIEIALKGSPYIVRGTHIYSRVGSLPVARYIDGTVYVTLKGSVRSMVRTLDGSGIRVTEG